MTQNNNNVVWRRRVHYFAGFDPRGVAHYHRMFKEAALTVQPSGAQLAIGKRSRVGSRFRTWTANYHSAQNNEQANPQTITECVYMGWDDVVRQHWHKTPGALLRTLLRSYASQAAMPALKAVYKHHRGAFWAGILPALYALLLLAVAAGACSMLLASPLPWSGALAALTASLVLWMGTRWAEPLGILWLLRIFAFNMEFGRNRIAGLEERQAEWLEDIVARQAQDPVDEVLLVAHSVGTLVFVNTASALLQDPRWREHKCRTGIVTLGQCMPFATLAPAATSFRSSLKHICEQTDAPWLDVTAKIDPLCFHTLHPLTAKPTPHDHKGWPRQVFAQFFRMYAPATWQKLSKKKLEVHFLYLKTPEKDGNFVMTDWLFGPIPLQQRIPAQP
jgi:hypothetical protein